MIINANTCVATHAHTTNNLSNRSIYGPAYISTNDTKYNLNNRLDTIEKILKDIMRNYPELIIKYPEIFKD